MAYEVKIPSLERIIWHDTECYPNTWTFGGECNNTGQKFVFEVSDRINQIRAFRQACEYWSFHDYTFVGFNNIGYDYPVIHEILTNDSITCAADIYKVSSRIIATPWHDRFVNRIPVWKHKINQIDLFLIHHFDNAAKSVSLKMLEFIMRMLSIQDLPFDVGITLTPEQIVVLIEYQDHDITATKMFGLESMEMMEFRHTLSHQFKKNIMNHNDGKVGEEYFIKGLSEVGVSVKDQFKKNKKTYRDSISIDEIIFPYIKFDHPEFNRVLNQMRSETIYETKGANNWSAVIDGFSYDIGLGGIHASLKKTIIKADDEYAIKDLDFASWYPHLSFNNGLFPEHLTENFCPAYKNLYGERKKHAKGTLLNKGLKFALNIPYGNSASEYSFFYDPKFTMSITINGQLILCMLADQLIKIPNLTMIQCNTDGLTIKYPRKYENQVLAIWKWIEQVTGIELEGVDYSAMYIRDVNNYIGVYTNGKCKTIGAYKHDTNDKTGGLTWSQDHGAVIIAKAACASLVEGVNIREYITNHKDMFDFFRCVKAPKTASLELHKPVMWGDSVVLENVKVGSTQNITRYYISNSGFSLIKRMTPLKRKTGVKVKMFFLGWQSKKITGMNKNLEVTTEHEYNSAYRIGYRCKDGGNFTHTNHRLSGVDKEWLITPINKIEENQTYDINYEYYIHEAKKLADSLLN